MFWASNCLKLVAMSFARRAMSLFVLTLLLGPSAMACMAPEAQLTPAEQKCCRMMAHHCGGMAHSSHSCCKTAVGPDNNYFSVQRVIAPPAANSVFQSAVIQEAAIALPLATLDAIATAHPPPGALDRIIVLRI